MSMDKNPNPQGKGLTPVLANLATIRPVVAVPPKGLEQITSELFTSLFVLGSAFKFQPKVGRSYWLYRRAGDQHRAVNHSWTESHGQEEKFHLSLIAPHQWTRTHSGQWIGECVLQPDLTWSLDLAESARQDSSLMRWIEVRRREFEDKLASAVTLDQALPVYEKSLPYHQRVLAYGLAFSLGVSMAKGGLQGLGYREAKALPVGSEEK